MFFYFIYSLTSVHQAAMPDIMLGARGAALSKSTHDRHLARMCGRQGASVTSGWRGEDRCVATDAGESGTGHSSHK